MPVCVCVLGFVDTIVMYSACECVHVVLVCICEC